MRDPHRSHLLCQLVGGNLPAHPDTMFAAKTKDYCESCDLCLQFQASAPDMLQDSRQCQFLRGWIINSCGPKTRESGRIRTLHRKVHVVSQISNDFQTIPLTSPNHGLEKKLVDSSSVDFRVRNTPPNRQMSRPFSTDSDLSCFFQVCQSLTIRQYVSIRTIRLFNIWNITIHF